MDELLKQFQEKRNTLAKVLRDLGDRQADWTNEDRQKWSQLNQEYNENLKALQDRRHQVEAEEQERRAIAERLAQVDAYQPYQPAARTPLIGRDGAGLGAGPVNRQFFGSPEVRQEFSRLQFLALQGWLIANSVGQEDLLRDEHIEAARSLRVNLRGREIVIRVGDTAHFQNVQRFYRSGARSDGHGQLQNAIDFWNSMQSGKGSTGGFLVGETLLARLEEAMLDYSGVLQVAEVIRTDTGEPILWPMIDDTSNKGSRVGEGQDAGTASDPTVKRLRLQAFDYTSGFLHVSRSLLSDSVMDLESMFGRMLGARIGRKQNDDYTTGTDVGNGPIGLVTASTLGVTAASATAIAFDEIIDLSHKVDPALRREPSTGYMMHDSIIQVVRKLKDGNGQYLWSNGTQAMQPDRINGYPYWLNQSMDSTVASGKKSMLFGVFNRYKVRQVNEVRIQRLIERRAEFNEDVFIAYMRADGGLLNPGDNPVKHLVH